MIDYESKKWINDYREVKAGTVAVTGSGKLRDKGVKQIIHAVGPQWTTGYEKEEEQLYSAVSETLKFAERYGCKSVALPALSSGIFKFPKRLCAKVMFDAVEEFAEKHYNDQDHEYLEEIHFTNFDLYPTVQIFQ